MSEENFKKQIIFQVEIFLLEITKNPKHVESKILLNSLSELENFFEILTNYIQDERLNLNLEGMEITPQSKKRLDNAEKLFRFTKNEFSDIKKIILQNKDLDNDEVTGKITLEYDVDSDTMVYLSQTRGFKPGGSNLTFGRTKAGR